MVGTQLVRACTPNDGGCVELCDRSLHRKTDCASGSAGSRAYWIQGSPFRVLNHYLISLFLLLYWLWLNVCAGLSGHTHAVTNPFFVDFFGKSSQKSGMKWEFPQNIGRIFQWFPKRLGRFPKVSQFWFPNVYHFLREIAVHPNKSWPSVWWPRTCSGGIALKEHANRRPPIPFIME